MSEEWAICDEAKKCTRQGSHYCDQCMRNWNLNYQDYYEPEPTFDNKNIKEENKQ